MRGRRFLQPLIHGLDRAVDDLREIRTGDPRTAEFASFGRRSRIEGPQVNLQNLDAVAIGDGVTIRSHVNLEVIAGPPGVRLRFGDGALIGSHSRFVVFNGIELEEEAGVGYGVTVADSTHEWTASTLEQNPGKTPLKPGPPLRIETGAWVGNNCVLMGSITIGARSIIGAGTVLTRSVPPETLVAGNPPRHCGSTTMLRRMVGQSDTIGPDDTV